MMSKHPELQIMNDQIFQQSSLQKIEKEQMCKFPHRFIGVLICETRSKEKLYGTGFLISPNLVLTAAHNLFQPNTGQIYLKMKFYPGAFGALQNPFQIEDFIFPGKFMIKSDVSSDYALLKLKQSILSQKYLSLSAQNNNATPKLLQIFGYPWHLWQKTSKQPDKLQVCQTRSTQNNSKITLNKEKGEIIHKISTAPGMSGSPIIFRNGDSLNVIGIHKGKIRLKQQSVQIANQARLITKQLISELILSAKLLKGIMFQVDSGKHSCQQHEYIQENQQFLFKYYLQQNTKLLRNNKITFAEKQQKKTSFLDIVNLQTQQKNCSNNLPSKEQKQKYKNIYPDPSYKQTYYTLANALSKSKEKGPSIDYYKKVIQIDPSFLDAYKQLTTLLYSTNQFQETIHFYKKYLLIDPVDINILNRLGNISYEQQQYQKAQEYYEKVIQLDPSYKYPYNGIGNIFRKNNSIQKSLFYYFKAIELDPNDKCPYKNISKIISVKENQRFLQQIETFLEKIIKKSKYNKTATDFLSKIKSKMKSQP